MRTTRKFACCLAVPAVLAFCFATTAWAQDRRDGAANDEFRLLAVLRSDAPAAEKAVTCKLLAIHGTSESVSELAKLLPDPQLSSWARIALEAIPGPAADEALRQAAAALEGRLLVGMINSIGVRRDANAVEILTRRLNESDADVASAAAVALGRIGNDSATTTLRAALATDRVDVRSAIAEGCVLCAERLMSDGESARAAEIYDEVRVADVPRQRIIEATRGAILARGEAGIPLLMEQFRSPDKDLFQLALGTAREFPGREVDRVLAEEMVRSAPDRAALMIQAMADRRETVVLPAVLQAAATGDRLVRLSAVDALGRIGDDSCLDTLIETAIDVDAGLAQAALASLAAIPGERIDSKILAILSGAEGKTRALLIGLVGMRRIEATEILLAAVNDPDRSVRTAALTALGETVALENLSVLISQVVRPEHPGDLPTARQALKAASVRMPDREACATELAAALERAPASSKSVLLEILGEVGGAKALATIGAAAKSSDPEMQDVGSRLLGKWNSVDAAPVLLDLARTAAESKYQIRALRGYIGIIRKFDMPASQRAQMCKNAFEVASRSDEQKLVLEVLKLYPDSGTLTLAVDAIQLPGLKPEATEATLAIAQKIGGRDIDLSQLLASAGFEKIRLEIVQAEYGAGSTWRDVTELVRKQAGDLPWVTLPATGYNASFGGDPAPGIVKKLKIRYRINGAEGESSFDENAPIFLMPPR